MPLIYVHPLNSKGHSYINLLHIWTTNILGWTSSSLSFLIYNATKVLNLWLCMRKSNCQLIWSWHKGDQMATKTLWSSNIFGLLQILPQTTTYAQLTQVNANWYTVNCNNHSNSSWLGAGVSPYRDIARILKVAGTNIRNTYPCFKGHTCRGTTSSSNNQNQKVKFIHLSRQAWLAGH